MLRRIVTFFDDVMLGTKGIKGMYQKETAKWVR